MRKKRIEDIDFKLELNMKKSKITPRKVTKIDGFKPKKFDVNNVKKSWSIVSDGKPLSRNVIYIGNDLPDFLLQNYQREIYTLSRRDGSIVDDNIRQKVKKTIIKELLTTGHKYEARMRNVKDTATVIKNVSVKIKHVPRKGWAIIIGKRKSTDIDTDTIKIKNYLAKKGITVDDEAICPTYCVPKKEHIVER